MNFQEFPRFNIAPPVFQPLNPASYFNREAPQLVAKNLNALVAPIAEGIQNAVATHLKLKQMQNEAGWRQAELGLEHDRLTQQGDLTRTQREIEANRLGEESRHNRATESLTGQRNSYLTPFGALTGVDDGGNSPQAPAAQVDQQQAPVDAALPTNGGGTLDPNADGNNMGLFPASADLSGGFQAKPVTMQNTATPVDAKFPDLSAIDLSQTTASNGDSGIVARPPVAGSKAFELSLSGQPEISLAPTAPEPAPVQQNQGQSPYDAAAADLGNTSDRFSEVQDKLEQTSGVQSPAQAQQTQQQPVAAPSKPFIVDDAGNIVSLPFDQRRKAVMDQISARPVVKQINGTSIYQDEAGRPYAIMAINETPNGLEEERAYQGARQTIKVPLLRKYNLPAELIQQGLHQNVVADQWTSPQEFAAMLAEARSRNGATLNEYQQKFLDQAESQLQRTQEHLEDRARPYTEALNTLQDGYRQGNNLGDQAMMQSLQSLLRGGTPGRGAQAQQLLTQGQGLLDRFQGELNKLQGKGLVDPALRQQVLQFGQQLAQSHVHPFQQQLDQARQLYVGRAKMRNIPEDAFTPRQITGFEPQQSNDSATPAASYPSMPSNKAELKPGQTYQTPRGAATWDGSKFTIVK
jgi:hypothetical protein